jgi:hypothetical protein
VRATDILTVHSAFEMSGTTCPTNKGDVSTHDQMEKFHRSPMLRKEQKELIDWLTCPTIQRHIPEDLNPQKQSCEDLTSRRLQIFICTSLLLHNFDLTWVRFDLLPWINERDVIWLAFVVLVLCLFVVFGLLMCLCIVCWYVLDYFYILRFLLTC